MENLVISFIRYVPNRFLYTLVIGTIIMEMSSSFFLRVAHVSPMVKLERMFATKTKYWDQRNWKKDATMIGTMVTIPTTTYTTNRTVLRQDLELIQTQIVARHGIRYCFLYIENED